VRWEEIKRGKRNEGAKEMGGNDGKGL